MSQGWRVILFVLLDVFLCFQVVKASPSIKVTARVLDENHIPIEGANVIVWYSISNESGIGTGDHADRGNSNKDGKFSSSSESFMPQVTIEAKADGYYNSGQIVEFEGSSKLLNRWEPWNPIIEMILKKKRNPVPMFIKGGTSTSIPVFGQTIGYDLEKGEWVSPYGQGINNDFLFTCQHDRVDFDNAEASCEITFSNEMDGIQEYLFGNEDYSSYKWPFEAPENNYKKSLYKWMTIHFPKEGYKTNIDDKINYIFRVRTKTDSQGKIIYANYGKIKRDFLVSRKGKIKFFYYLNPDGTRNLEEDPEKNLFDMK